MPILRMSSFLFPSLRLGDACYESAWIDKLLGDSDVEDDEETVIQSRRQSHRSQNHQNRDSCYQDNSRQEIKTFGIIFSLHDDFDFSYP